MRKNKALLLLLLVSLLLSACGQAQERSSPYRIYLISKSTSTEFWRSVFAGANAARADISDRTGILKRRSGITPMPLFFLPSVIRKTLLPSMPPQKPASKLS